MAIVDALGGGTRTAPVVVALRHVLVAEGTDESGTPALAVWQADELGRPLAGWVFPTRKAYGERETARRLLAAAVPGALVGARAPGGRCRAVDVLDRLSRSAGVPGDHAGRALVEVACVVAEIAGYERRYASAVRNWQGLRLRYPRPAATGDVVTEVLAVAGQLRACAALWQRLEEARCRYPALRERFGPARQLPPYWQRRLDVAGQRRLIGGTDWTR
jgi:Family of unknown function (DUF6218)